MYYRAVGTYGDMGTGPHFGRLVKVNSQDLCLSNIFELVVEFEFSPGPFCSNYIE